MAIPAMLTAGRSANQTPLAYGDDLFAFLDAGAGVSGSGDSLTWTDQGPSGFVFSVPAGDDEGPVFNGTFQNGQPGLVFGGDIDTRLTNNAAGLDNFFSGAGFKGIGFAAKLGSPMIIPGVGRTVLLEKSYFGTGTGNQGWIVEVNSAGDFIFAHQNTSDGDYKITASGFYSANDLVLGWFQYSGGMTTSSVDLFLWNGSTFVETGSFTIPSPTTRGSDANKPLCIGNIETATGSGGFNAAWSGGIMGLWMTKPANASIDPAYLRRFIP